MTPRKPKHRSAFTLTEILIALAMVAFMLIGISRIFAITSATIGTGQAMSAAMRQQRAIEQQLASDVLGVLPTNGNLKPYSGIMPSNAASGPNDGAPFLQICNFRVPAYMSAAAYKGDGVAPPSASPATPDPFVGNSKLIRGVDTNNDGVETTTSITNGGESTPLFFYGDRNFRCDNIGFFSRGQFHSQTGTSGTISRVFGTVGTGLNTLGGDLNTSEAYIWYGHARVYNGDPKAVDRSAGFKQPGEWSVVGAVGNQSNQFASQFILSRVQLLLAEPTDHDARTGTYSTTVALGGPDRKLAEDNTVVASNDPDKPVLFLQRKWWDPNAHHIDEANTNITTRTRPLFSPLTINDPVVVFQRDSSGATDGKDRTVYTNETTNSTGTSSTSGLATTNYQSLFGRTDVAGMGVHQARQRSRFLEQYDATYPPTTSQTNWWESMYVSSATRFWANPYAVTAGYTANESNVNAKSLAQRQQILASGVSQFIVEFAGDFVTQRTDPTPANRFGEVTDIIPDGVPDFVVLPNGKRTTRWYGLPRDVDGNGSIPATPAAAITSPDVLPVSATIPSALFPGPVIKWLPFERTPAKNNPLVSPYPLPVNNDYANNVDEPSGATSPDATRYVCIWGAQEFERNFDIAPDRAVPGHTPVYIHGQYPTMIRFVIDVVDDKGKLVQPVTQELVYPVPDESTGK